MVKYVVIDLSKLDGDKLSKMLTEAYEQGYKDAQKEKSYSPGYESTGNYLNGTSSGYAIRNADFTTMTNLVTSSSNTIDSITASVSAIDGSTETSVSLKGPN